MNLRSILFFICFFLLSFNVIIAQMTFDEVSSQLGITNSSGNLQLGAGVSFVDFDDDGWDDLTVASGNNIPLRFYKNNNGTFVEIFPLSIPILGQTKSTTWVDIDNDGDKDLYVTTDNEGNKLFENDGNLGLTDITSTSGLPTGNLYTYGASWGEIDNDGYLDVFISNRRVFETSVTNYLYKNNGDGTFTDYTEIAGIELDIELTFCSGFIDYDNDGWQDIYIANDKSFPNKMYHNNGDGTYSDASLSTGTGIVIDAMSVSVEDFNADGYLDIYVTNTHSPISEPGGNVFFRNNGDGTFTNIATISGTIFNSFCWGASFIDADNDMDLDLYVSSSRDGSDPTLASYNLYVNQGFDSFTIATSTGMEGDSNMSYSNAIGDIDNDGRGDIVVFNMNNSPSLYHNSTSNSNNYLGVKLTGTQSNSDGVGSLIEISINGNKQYRYTMCGEGYLAQNSEKELFGLGSNDIVDYVKVKWLSGIEDVIYDVAANQTLQIIEGSTLSIEEYQNDNFDIYPIPVSNDLNVISRNPINNYTIYNLQGEKVLVSNYSISTTNTVIDVSSVSSGLYFLKLKYNDDKTITRKFVKK
ncbi:FG-GAP-like repeat-containing protein [Ichthyenterobacterium sp. W332]|uniref:FG-GAP-like repeat-containing protein n=1 Tax=Microcosmobacter mediterraneus TaxID=3075607 RepID=A0ABU2YH99_9FLAO|nr:FG-GAP-like repeat-containing protein [Ichthyenterobacterium sp. W332]MDT0557542.1 FG-GAP-like repeat-containing protein [Ichthyenterobacterium sp. W332]